jgi:hypothetical protein
MNWQIFIVGILTLFSPVIAFFQDTGWRIDADDFSWRFFSWLGRLSWDQQYLACGMIFAGILLISAAVLIGWKAW